MAEIGVQNIASGQKLATRLLGVHSHFGVLIDTHHIEESRNEAGHIKKVDTAALGLAQGGPIQKAARS